MYLVITNELLRLEQRSLEAVTLHGPSSFWASRILLIAGVTQSWQASRGSLWAKYLVRSRVAGHRKLTISPKWTHPSLDILRSSYEKIKFNIIKVIMKIHIDVLNHCELGTLSLLHSKYTEISNNSPF